VEFRWVEALLVLSTPYYLSLTTCLGTSLARASSSTLSKSGSTSSESQKAAEPLN
jgi:hypothetical protein